MNARDALGAQPLPEEHLRALLRRIVEINTVSDNLEGLAQVAQILQAELESVGMQVELHARRHPRQPVNAELDPLAPGDEACERGLHLVARLGAPAGHPTALLIGHMDTVYARESPFRALEVDGDRACGPGVVDMKGGLVVICGAVRALVESGAPRPNLLLVINSDEEVSSNTSRPLFEELIARERPDFALCVEPGERRADGSEELVVERKGHCCLHVGIYGRAAHASKPELGISALSDLARKIVELEALALELPGVTVNVGRCVGAPDATYNTVPRYAQAEIDVRFDDVVSGRAFVERAKALLSRPGQSTQSSLTTRARIEEVFFSPPLPPHPGQRQIVDALRRAAATLGYPYTLVPTKRPGRSDANIAATLGVPSIDGLGIVGSGSHVAFGEVALLSSLVPRARLLALALSELTLPSKGSARGVFRGD